MKEPTQPAVRREEERRGTARQGDESYPSEGDKEGREGV